MTTETMTIHKALCELKIIDDRIADAIADCTYVIENKHINKKVNGVPIEQFKSEALAAKDRIMDLGARRNAIKRAVVLSNATTKVTIGGVEYTVAEAIEMKNHGLDWKRCFVNQLASDLRCAEAAISSANGNMLEARADNFIKSQFGDKPDAKTSPEVIFEARQKFIEEQQLELLDPLHAKDFIQELNDEINAFMVDVDSALSVSNAMTNIEISY